MSDNFEELNRAVELEPDNAEAYKLRGNAYIRDKEFDKAIVDYEKAIELKKDFHQAYSNLGYALTLQGKFAEAVEILNKAIEIKPDFPSSFYNRGLAFEKLREHHKAIDDLTKTLELDSSFTGASSSRLGLFCITGFYAKSVKNFLDLKEVEKNGNLKVQLPKVLVDSPYHFDRIAAVYDWVDEFNEENISLDEVPENLLQSYGVMYYQLQVRNGGITQFVYNSNWNPLIVNAVKDGLKNMNAKMNFDLFSRVVEYVDGLGSSLWESMENDYTDYADKIKYLRTLNDEYYEIKDEESIEELHYEFIGTFKNLELV